MKFKNTIKKFKLYVSTYQLQFKNKKNSPLEGSLLAFDFDSHLTGYSDFLPWPAFGEKNLFDQLNKIKQGEFSKRFLIAKHNAYLDAKARSQNKNLFFGLKIPPSHFLIEDLLNFKNQTDVLKKGFKKIKVKLKPYEIVKQAEKLKTLHSDFKDVKWRLDLNGISWSLWKNKLCFLRKDIDFIEDPLLDKSSLEKSDQSLFAQDWLKSPHFQIKIIKASRDSLKFLIKELACFRWKRLIFTHSLDHPLGQVISAFWAGQFYKNYQIFFETGGLINSSLIEKTDYCLNQKKGPHFLTPSGFGFGFSNSLAKEKWKKWI